MVLFCPSTALIALLETNVLKAMLAAKLVAPRPASNTLKRNKLLLAIFTPPRVWCRLSFDKWCDYIRFRLPAKSRNTVKQYRTVSFFTDTRPHSHDPRTGNAARLLRFPADAAPPRCLVSYSVTGSTS